MAAINPRTPPGWIPNLPPEDQPGLAALYAKSTAPPSPFVQPLPPQPAPRLSSPPVPTYQAYAAPAAAGNRTAFVAGYSGLTTTVPSTPVGATSVMQSTNLLTGTRGSVPGAVQVAYNFIVGDDLRVIFGNYNPALKALAAADLASNLLLVLPIAGDWIKAGTKGAFLAADRMSEEAAEKFILKEGSAAARKSWWRYKPSIRGTPDLEQTFGGTSRFGHVEYSNLGSYKDQAVALAHELVHLHLTPRYGPFLNARTIINAWSYEHSQLLTYTEETLAEAIAQARVYGPKNVPEALTFVFDNPTVYRVTRSGLLREATVTVVAIHGGSYAMYVVDAGSVTKK